MRPFNQTVQPLDASSHTQGSPSASSVSRSSVSPGSLLRDGCLSLLLFVLLWEWVRPLPYLSDVSELYVIKPFLIVFGLCLAVDWLKLPAGLGWVCKAVIVLASLGFLFYPTEFWQLTWVLDLAKLIVQDVLHILQVRLDLLSPQFRTLLFMVGWVFMIAVAQGFMLQRQQGLWFIAMTLLYLLVLQITYGLDTTQGIIRTLGCGMILLALLNLSRIEHVFCVRSGQAGWPARWLFISLAAAALVAGIGWYGSQSPKAELIRPLHWDAVTARWESLHMKSSPRVLTASAQTGYSSDDSQLGGPLIPDDSVMFTAFTPELTYWRGESKSTYTGKGWAAKETAYTNYVPDTSVSQSAPFTQEVMLDSSSPGKQLFIGGNLASIDALLARNGEPLSPELVRMDRASGKVTVPEITEPLSYYKITAYSTKLDVEALGSEEGGTSVFTAAFADEYLQLPDKLPASVRKLTEQITAGLTGNYDKVSAIQQYLTANYSYSLDKPTFPRAGEDFVSHFLFVDRTGYCEHFSTAMAVMLRSIGIPAKWVKGFAPGEDEQPADAAVKHVTVKAKDSHAWVEVYFPNAGWVAFDPTPGFTSPTPLSQAGMLAGSNNQDLTSSSRIDQGQGKGGFVGFFTSFRNVLDALNALFSMYRIWMFVTAFVIAGSIILFIIWKRNGAPIEAGDSSIGGKSGKPVHPSLMQMNRMWRKLFRSFGPKPPHLTVREYVGGVQASNDKQKEALLEFTRLYEAVRYDEGKRYACSRNEIEEAWRAVRASVSKRSDR